MRFKILPLAALLIFYASLCKAETHDLWSLNLLFENDEMLNLEITDQLTIKVSDNNLVISQDCTQDGISYLISDIKRIEYAISQINTYVSEFLDSSVIKFHRNYIEISPMGNPVEVKIYSFDGNMVYASPISDSLQIDLSTYSKGVYILSINNSSSIKFLIK